MSVAQIDNWAKEWWITCPAGWWNKKTNVLGFQSLNIESIWILLFTIAAFSSVRYGCNMMTVAESTRSKRYCFHSGVPWGIYRQTRSFTHSPKIFEFWFFIRQVCTPTLLRISFTYNECRWRNWQPRKAVNPVNMLTFCPHQQNRDLCPFEWHYYRVVCHLKYNLLGSLKSSNEFVEHFPSLIWKHKVFVEEMF